jgi:aminomethyltransferase
LNYSPLYQEHKLLGARFVAFAGWQMPLIYKGALYEHMHVRNQAGLFDLSHMGRIEIMGNDALAYLDFLSTNHILNKQDGSATYTVWCNPAGFAIEDTIVYRINSKKAFVIANAANREKDLEHLFAYSGNFFVTIHPRWEDEGILALQGPNSTAILQKLFPDIELAAMHFTTRVFAGHEIIISRTGYTGSLGYEFFAPTAVLNELWLKLITEEDVEPIGLAARDSLRLEAGFALYGHELSETISPCESISAWTTHYDKDFLGKEAMQAYTASGKKRHAAAFILQGKAIAREGSPVHLLGKPCGVVTSGGYSPALQAPIALALLNSSADAEEGYEIAVRNQTIPAQKTKLPFFKNRS